MSILSGGGRTYGFDLDLIKSPSPSSARSSSSSPSSTLSESSNSPLAIFTKRARAPRKRPNQSYSEAVALLSTIYPSLFSTKNFHKLSKHSKPFSSLSPSLAFSSLGFDLKPGSPKETTCIEYQEPSSPDSPDYDVESILDEEVGEGIDSIMGNLSVENSETNCNSYVNPHLGSLMGFGYGLGGNSMHRALRGAHYGDWWRHTTVVAVGDIVPKFNASPPLEKKKKAKKKKKKVEELKDEPKLMAATKNSDTTSPSTSGSSLDVEPKAGLGLKLNHEDVLSAWSDREFPFSNESGTQESSADIIARLAQIELFPENGGGGVREASVQRYREKRRSRLFSKKIRYQVRKANADQRPRMKASGRFVKRPYLLQELIEKKKANEMSV